MRKLILCFIGILVLQCMTYTTHAQASLLTGLWVPVQQEMGGAALPSASFASQELHISDSLYTLIAESIDKGMLKLSGNRMDIFSKEGVNAGKQFKAIYRMDREQLVICYDLTGKEYPADFSTAGKPLWFMVVYKKKSIKQ